jgi:hypothetical protein
MIYLVSLNEITLLRFCALILFKRNVKVLRIAPFMLMTNGLLARLVGWAIRTGRTEYAVKLTSELQDHWDFNGRFAFQEIFKKYEPWQNQYFGFHGPRVEGDKLYGYGFKKITCSYTFWKVIEIHVLDAITRKNPASAYKVYGLLADTKEMGRFILGPSFAKDIKTMFYPRIVINPIFTLLAYAYTLAWVFLKTRFSVRQSKVAVMFEMMKDGREIELFKEISDAGKCVLIDRFPDAPSNNSVPEEMDAVIHRRTDGLFSILASLKALIFTTTDIFKIGRRYWNAPPALFFEMLSFPYKRLLVRGLLNRYQPDVFIARDEYNVDHVLRRMETKKRGVLSIGFGNALFPCFWSLAPNARYASYDIYYVDAAPLFDQYLDTWAPDMEVRTFGGYSMPREKLNSALGGKGNDILFTMRVAWNQPELVTMVRRVAEAFPDRKVYLQFKKGFLSKERIQRLIEECSTGLQNVVLATDDVYTLLDTAKYHISDISTFVAEAIRSGMVTLVADILEMEFTCYRSFPNLCSRTAGDLVQKLMALENGETAYPHDEYFKMLGYRAGEVGFDLLRQDLNLPSKAEANL